VLHPLLQTFFIQ